mgnify:CR=1 FL=1
MSREQALEHMSNALELAARGLGTTRPNPMVGALVVRDGRVVGQGYHHKAGGPHAEVHALREAGAKARGAELIVTLEPCCHVGRTPPCTEAIIEAGISRVWIGHLDPNPRVAGKGVEFLRQAGIEVHTGIMERACAELNAGYNHWMKHGRPKVTLKLASSLDGKIATASGESQWITGPKSRRAVHAMRAASDCIMVGIGTALADDPSLTVRDVPFTGPSPTRLIVDSKLRLGPQARVLNQDGAEIIIATSSAAPQHRRENLQSCGATLIEASGGDGRVDLKLLFDTLGQKRRQGAVRSILVEGGGELSASLIEQGLVDELRLFIAPLCIGGDGINGLAPLGVDALSIAPRFTLTSVTQHGEDVELLFQPREENTCSQD